MYTKEKAINLATQNGPAPLDLMSIEEVGTILRVNKDTVHRYIRQHRMQCYSINYHTKLVSKKQLEAFLTGCENSAHKRR